MDSEYDHTTAQDDDVQGPHPHPYLHEALLYISNIPPYVTDENIAMAFVNCGPFRPKIPRDGTNNVLSGTIEFKFVEKAEKALATLQSRPLPGLQPAVPLVLSPYPPTNPPTPLPPPSALPRLVKQMPPGYTDTELYDLFRPFGALAAVRTQTQFGPDTGTVEFWNEGDARAAEQAMHCAEVNGQNIAVQVYQQRRTSAEFNTSAPAFVPSGPVYPTPAPYPTQYSPHSPPRGSPYMRSPAHGNTVLPFMHGPGQQVQLAPLSGPGSSSHSGLIDPCNLFCKNLDPEIDSNSLFTHFRPFGQIVSARVMRNESGESRGFGFVSFQTPDQAAAALNSMNGIQLGSKQIIVRLHEPKQLRQEKLAARFAGHNGHPRSASGATSPSPSEAGDSYAGWSSPRRPALPLGSPVGTPDRGRRGSGSYYNAALSGNLPMRYDDLAALSPVVRKEVLTGDLSRRVKALEVVDDADVSSIVNSLVGLSLSEVLSTIEDPIRLQEQVESLKKNLKPKTPSALTPAISKSPSPSVSQDSRLDPNAAAAIASAPEHPSTPVSVSAGYSTPPRTSSPSGSLPPASEKERMLAAVSKLENSRQKELAELLMTLPKRERAMCLFNVETLRSKLVDAKMVLDSEEAEDEQPEAPAAPVPATPQAKKTAPKVEESPKTPALSSRGPSAASSPMPNTPSGPSAAAQQSYASLAKLPATEIIKLANSPSSDLPLDKADPIIIKTTDEFIDSLANQPIQAQKQKLGEKLFKVVKSFGIKSAPKITVTLLDQEDLRSLAHLMNSYPEVLKEKALAVKLVK